LPPGGYSEGSIHLDIDIRVNMRRIETQVEILSPGKTLVTKELFVDERSSKIFHEAVEPRYRIIVIRRGRHKAEIEIEPMG
jgi:hypothetical protein